MKKLMSLVALAVVGSVVAASAQEVLSANAVGYVKRTVPAGGFQIVSIPFDNIASEDGSYTFGETQVAEDLPTQSQVMFWDAAAQSWKSGRKTAKGWQAMASQPIQPGEAFFVKGPDASGELEVTAAGEVPSEGTLTRSYAGNSAFSIVASPYPVDVAFGDTEIAQALPTQSEVMFWDSAAQSWKTGRKTAKGWQAMASQPVQAGEGFFVKSASEGSWEAVKPYTWP